MITENVSTLKIHKLTKKQYERELKAGNLDANALYITPEDSYYNTSQTSDAIFLTDITTGATYKLQIQGGQLITSLVEE